MVTWSFARADGAPSPGPSRPLLDRRGARLHEAGERELLRVGPQLQPQRANRRPVPLHRLEALVLAAPGCRGLSPVNPRQPEGLPRRRIVLADRRPGAP